MKQRKRKIQPEQVLVNPQTAIRLFVRTYVRIGNEIFRNRKYKITREAWICSMFLLALKKHSGGEWFLTPERKYGSPDFHCHTFVRSKKMDGYDKPEIKLEVFEWRGNDVEHDFLKALNKIKLHKLVDPQLTLLCYIRKSTTIPSAIQLNKKLKELNPKVKDIWYLGDVTPDSKTWRVTQVYPNTLAINLDYDKVLSSTEEQSFIYAYRGKSKEMKYEPSGKQVILTPEFEIKFDRN